MDGQNLRVKVEPSDAMRAVVKTVAEQEAFDEVERYRHHGNKVAVRSALKGLHRDHCLCWVCDKFQPEYPDDNCPIANALYALDVLTGCVTPVWECPEFEEA